MNVLVTSGYFEIRFNRKGQAGVWRVHIADFALLIFLAVYSAVVMSAYDLRVAAMPQDDGPIFYADVFKNPQNYYGVYQYNYPVEDLIKLKVFSSAPFFLAAALWRFLGIDPYWVTFVILLTQVTSIGLAVYFFARALTRERIVALLAAIFVYPAQVQNYTAANYGPMPFDLVFPYSAYLAIAPGLIAFVLAIRGKTVASLIMLAVTGLIHPNLAVFAAGIIGFYWIWEGIQERAYRVVLYRMSGLLVAGIVFMLPALLLYFSPSASTQVASAHQFIDGLKHNQHLWPWQPFWSYTSLHGFLAWLCLALLSWRHRERFSAAYRRLWLTSLVVGLMFSLLHILGGIFEIPLLLNLCGLRAMSWFSLIALPLIILYWYEYIRSGNWLGAVLALSYFFLPLAAKASYNFSWLLILGFALLDLSGVLHSRRQDPSMVRKANITFVVAVFIWILWFAAFLLLPEGTFGPAFSALAFLTWVGDPLWGPWDRLLFLALLVLLATLIWRAANRSANATADAKRPLESKNTLPMLLAAFVIVYIVQYVGLQLRSPYYQTESDVNYLLQAQLWAKENTPANSLFVTDLSWMNSARRGRFYPFTREADQYLASPGAEEFRLRLLHFYGVSEQEANQNRGRGIVVLEAEKYAGFRDADFLRFASEFGATHLVILKSADHAQITLPLVYENQYIAIYTLDH